MLDVTLLGTSGTLPLPGRYLSSALIRIGGKLFLIDCGEGTQVALRAKGWGIRRIDSILLTHSHADHVLGLPGLLLTLAFSQRGAEEPLRIFGPPSVLPVLESIRVFAPRLPYPVYFIPLEVGDEVDVTDNLKLFAGPTEHDVPCLSYSLYVPRSPKFDVERANSLGVPRDLWGRLQRGESVFVGEREIQPQDVLGPPRKGLKLVFITDTRFTEDLVSFASRIQPPDLLISEGMYGDESMRPKDWDVPHMTFAEAAKVASASGARLLWLTHYSPMMADPSRYIENARRIFPNAIAAQDGTEISLSYED